MNGRCENDPFDQARNVCGLCYGEFCLSCLVNVKGRKHPLCKECAIIASGIRGGAKPTPRGPKRTAPARRTALAEAPIRDNFQFFDTNAGNDLAAFEEQVDQEPEQTKSRSKRKRPAKPAKAKTPKKPAAKKAPKKPTAKSQRAAKKEKAEDPKPPAVDPELATISSSERIAAATAKPEPTPSPTPEPASAPAPEEPPAETVVDEAANASAVDQLDSIRGHALDDTVELPEQGDRSFRKPRPFIKSATTPGSATSESATSDAAAPVQEPAAEPAAPQRPASPQQPAAQPQPVARPEPVAEAKPAAQAQPAAQQPTSELQGSPIDPHAIAEQAREGVPKPLPARRRSAGDAAAKPAAAQAPQTQPPAHDAEKPAAQAEPAKQAEPAEAKAKTPITSELTSPFSVAPPPALPRRRAKPLAGQDPYERAEPDAVVETDPGTEPARRQSDSQAKEQPASTPASGLPRRRAVDAAESPVHQPEAEAPVDDAVEPPAIRPPAWTQRPHNRRADDHVGAHRAKTTPAATADADDTTELPIESDTTSEKDLAAAGPKPLPKRRRSS